MFPIMHEIVPPGEKGEAQISHFEVSEQDISIYNIRASMNRTDPMKVGKFVKLKINGKLMMTDTEGERRSNAEIFYAANGKCLIGGLGLGMLVCGLMKKEEVTNITVVEKSQDVIDLVLPHIQQIATKPLHVVHSDIFNYTTKEKFDTIYMDIWGDLSTDDLKSMSTLNRKFGRNLNRTNPNAIRMCWQEDHLRARQERGWR